MDIVFHLNNQDAKRKLNLMVQGTNLMNDSAPKYLEIKLDTLNFNQRFEDVKNKLKTKHNIIRKVAGTSWGCRAHVFRASALIYSVVEYCTHVWGRNVHTKKFETRLNCTIKIITGYVRYSDFQSFRI